MKKLFIIFVSLFAPYSLFAQGAFVPPQTALKTLNGQTYALPGATITVCAALAAGLPCSPALVGAVFSDVALTIAKPNPFTADANGNYQFAIAAGAYTVTVTAAGYAGYSYQASVVGSITGVVNTWTALQKYSGGASFLGGVVTFANNINPTPAVAGAAGLGTVSLPWVNLFLGPGGSFNPSNELIGGATGSNQRVNQLPDASGVLSQAVVQYCGATSGATQACANTVKFLPFIVFGDVQLNTATTQVITTLPFTAAADYSCSGSDLTTPAGIVSFPTYTSGAQVTIQETGGANTDHLRYMCVGF